MSGKQREEYTGAENGEKCTTRFNSGVSDFNTATWGS